MNYGINLGYLTKKAPFETAAKILAESGFTTLDYTPNYKAEDWEALTYKNLQIIEKNGLSVHQTHAPFNRYGQYGENYMIFTERALQETIMMGAKYMVIHGDEFDFDNTEYTPEKALEYNYNLFAPIVEKAAANNVKIAFETVFEDDFKNNPRFCSKAEDLKALIEKFNTETVCCCWDFGHAGISFGEKHAEKILELGKYIECTHVQDYGHNTDLHLPPFLGDNNWDECMSAFAKIG